MVKATQKMPPRSSRPATKRDVDNAVEELARLTDKNFRRSDKRTAGLEQQIDGLEQRIGRMDHRTDRIEKTMVTKKDLEGMATKKDLEDVANKKDLEGIEDRVTNRVVTSIKAYLEQVMAEVQGQHDDEMAIVEGKNEAPVTWKSIPRRLKSVEQEVEKIKDRIA